MLSILGAWDALACVLDRRGLVFQAPQLEKQLYESSGQSVADSAKQASRQDTNISVEISSSNWPTA